MKTTHYLVRGVLTFILLLSVNLSFAQVDKKAKIFQKKGYYYYKQFQKAELLDNYPYTDKNMVTNLEKADINFQRALTLYNTRPKLYASRINKLKLYIKIIYYHIDRIKERRKEYTSSR
jgi:hypothetical protein